MTASAASCEAISLHKLLRVFHDCSESIEIWHHLIKYKVQRSVVVLEYVPSDSLVVDILKKP